MANKTLTAAASNLALVAPAAFREGVSREQVMEAVRIALGGTKSVKRFAEVRARYIIGRMAARIPSNQTDVVRLAQADVAFNSAGFEIAKLAKGKRRRSKVEQDAYNAGKTAWAALLRDAGIKSLDKRGGGSKSHPKTRGATGKRVKKAANNARPVTPTIMQPEKIAAFLDQQAAMLLAFNNKNVKRLSLDERNAIEAFASAIKSAHASK